jgi:hypothetical protein
LLTGKSQTHHDRLFWCKDGDEWAIRQGDWKLRSVKGETELFNLALDPSEKQNRTNQQAEKVKSLGAAFGAWRSQMANPISSRSKASASGRRRETTSRKQQRLEKRAERRKQRAAERDTKKQSSALDRVRDSESRPNVLFIICDDLNTHVSTSGYCRWSMRDVEREIENVDVDGTLQLKLSAVKGRTLIGGIEIVRNYR